MREKLRLFGEQLSYALMVAATTLVLAFLWGVLNATFFNLAPIGVETLDFPRNATFCPGENFDIHVKITLSKPIVLYTYIAVLDESLIQDLPDDQQNPIPSPHPVASTYNHKIPWVVPHLPPGHYNRVVGFRGPNGYEKAVYLIQPFMIGGYCKHE